MILKSYNVIKLQGKLSKREKKLSQGLTIPESKALRDITKGIISSGTLIVRQIASSLHEKISLDKVCERLYRNLKNDKLSDVISENIMKSNCSKATDDTYFIVDDSDIIKPSSHKIEGLARVRDGSTGKRLNGFHLSNITSLTDNGKYYSILPICSQLYSNIIEVDTSRNTLEDRIIDITIYSNNKGIYVFDRGYDSRKLITLLSNNGNNYILRSTGKRSLIVDEVEKPFKDVAKAIKRKHKFKTSKNKIYMCGVKRVKIRTNLHKIKNPDTVETTLVVARHGKKGGLFYLLCNFNTKDLTDYEIIEKALRGYGYRWKIEEFHRHVKQEFNWENIQLMSYAGLKNLNTILMVAVDIIYSAIKYIDELLYLYPEFGHLKEQTYKYVYYKLSRVIKHIFSNTKMNKIIPCKGEYHDKLQLRVKFS